MSNENGKRRNLRVEKELREVIARYLLAGFRGRIEGMASVSRVQVNSDLRSAKVFVSVMGTPTQQESSIEELQHFARDFQDEIHHQLRMRYTPKLTFVLDTGLEKQLKVEGILHKLEQERAKSGKKSADSKSSADSDDTEDTEN